MSLDNIDSVGNFYGFPVYVADRKCVRAYRANNFDLQGLHDHGRFWVTNEVIVALGIDVSRKRAIKTLQHVIKRIEMRNRKVAILIRNTQSQRQSLYLFWRTVCG
jgi:hypothetical protein